MKKLYGRRFQVEGLNLERYLRAAADSGIPLKGARRFGRTLTGVAAEEHMAALEALARQGGWLFTPLEAVGANRLWERLRRRWPLAALLALALAGVCVALQWVWTVEVLDAGSYAGDVRAYLTEAGVRPFVWKSSVDTAALRGALEWRYPKVAWVEVGWRGTALCVRLVEGTPKGNTVDWHGSRDVVASRDGVIVSVVPVAGTARCKPGDVVRKGQVLIAGEERDGAETVRPVSARGTVKARVWDGATVRVSLREKQTEYTGKKLLRQTVRSPWFDLWGMEEDTFAQADIHAEELPLGGLFFPLWVRREECFEARITTQMRDLDEAKAEAGLAALRALARRVGYGEVFVDKWVDYCMIEDEILEASAVGERRIDIGQARERGDAS